MKKTWKPCNEEGCMASKLVCYVKKELSGKRTIKASLRLQEIQRVYAHPLLENRKA